LSPQLLKEVNDLEMSLMIEKLLTQLTHPDENRSRLEALQPERNKTEEQRLKARTAPETEMRRIINHHQNIMTKKRNELNWFKKLNENKQHELEQLRSLGTTVVEQRNTMINFTDESIT
jgi:hypothetical protein